MPRQRDIEGAATVPWDKTGPAVAAAAIVARRLGVHVREPIVLHSSNNIVAWLHPSQVVAKVGVGHYDRLAEEIEIGDYLVRHGAPVVGPAAGIPPRVHGEDGYAMTFWHHEPQRGRKASHRAVATSLHALHDVLATLPFRARPLRSISESLDLAKQALTQPQAEARLAAADQAILANWLDRAIRDLAGHHYPTRVLHGSPHDGNLLSIDGTALFIDFETVAIGPLEWDLAHLDERAVRAYPEPHDRRRLALCRTFVSAQVAAWCWVAADRSPDLLWHAKHHLAAVKRANQ